jgi:hypothetical protein
MARCAQADDRFARIKILLKPNQLFWRQSHSPRKDEEQVSPIERLKAIDGVGLGFAFQVNGFELIFCFQKSGERRQSFSGMIFVFTADEHNRGWVRCLNAQHACQREEESKAVSHNPKLTAILRKAQAGSQRTSGGQANLPVASTRQIRLNSAP